MSSSSEDGAEVFLEGIDQNAFEGQDALVVFFEFSAAFGCSDFDPVGGAVAGAGEPLQFHKSFQKDGAVALAGELVGGYAPGEEGKQAGGEVAGLHPRWDQKAVVFDDQVKAGAVGDEFAGVDEVLSPAAQLSNSLLGGKVSEFDVFGDGAALGLEFIELALSGLEGTEGGPFLFLVTSGDLRFVFLSFQGVSAKESTCATEMSGRATHLAIEGSPVGINQACGFRKRADSPFYQTIQSIVFPHIFEEVFLIPSGEHGTR